LFLIAVGSFNTTAFRPENRSIALRKHEVRWRVGSLFAEEEREFVSKFTSPAALPLIDGGARTDEERLKPLANELDFRHS